MLNHLMREFERSAVFLVLLSTALCHTRRERIVIHSTTSSRISTGAYSYHCSIQPFMKGKVVVQ